MPIRREDFDRSIYYAYHLYDTNPRFLDNVYFLLSRLVNKKRVREYHCNEKNFYFDRIITALKDRKTIKPDYKPALKDGKDYRYRNLIQTTGIPMRRKNGKKEFFFGVAFYFNNKEACKYFLQEFNIKKTNVAFSAYIDHLKKYEVVFRFTNGVTEKQLSNLMYQANFVLEKNSGFYKDYLISNKCYLASTIHDRWFNPFKGKTMWNSKIIANSFNKTIDFSEFMKNIFIAKKKYTYEQIVPTSRPITFISNKNKLPNSILRENLYITNHFLQDMNPYKSSRCRKDWKLAAEAFLNEVIGKFVYKKHEVENYKQSDRILDEEKNNSVYIYKNYAKDALAYNNEYSEENYKIYMKCARNFAIEGVDNRIDKNPDLLNHLFFSKHELKLFINSLNLSTKINALKLRKVVLDKLVKLGILTTDGKYRVKCFCKSYKLVRDNAKAFYDKVKFNISNSLVVLSLSLLKIYYMLENHKRVSGCRNLFLWKNPYLLPINSGPPD